MSGKMGMSLDNIVKQNVKINPCTGGSSAGSTRSSSPSTGSSRKGGAVRNTHKPGGDVLRSRNCVGISRNRSSSGFDGPTRLIIRKALLGLVDDRKFDSASTKLTISNLDFGVMNSDILELFSEFGPLKSAGVHFDKSGRSLGSAEVIFERRSDAIKAIEQYNGVLLNGRELIIRLDTSHIPAFSSRRTSSSDGGFKRLGGRSFYDQAGDRSIDKDRAHPGNRPVSEGHGHPTNRPVAKSHGHPTNRPVAKGRGHSGKRDSASGKSAGGKAERVRQPKKTPTAEELDAELDEYMASVRTKSDRS